MTRIRIEPSRRRIRAHVGSHVVADSTGARLAFVERRRPEYYFPRADVDESALVAVEKTTHCPLKGDTEYYDVVVDGETVATTPAEVWELFEEHHGTSRELWEEKREIETHVLGRINHELEASRLRLREVELSEGVDSDAWRAASEEHARVEADCNAQFEVVNAQLDEIATEEDRRALVLETAQTQLDEGCIDAVGLDGAERRRLVVDAEIDVIELRGDVVDADRAQRVLAQLSEVQVGRCRQFDHAGRLGRRSPQPARTSPHLVGGRGDRASRLTFTGRPGRA